MAQYSGNVCNAFTMILYTEMPGSCIAAGYDDCCTLGACEGIPPNCMCDFYCFEFNDCCQDFFKICPRSKMSCVLCVHLKV